jgi:hypothetical protein
MTTPSVSSKDIKSIKLYIFRCMGVLAVLMVNIMLGVIFFYGAMHFYLLLAFFSGGLSIFLGYWNFKECNRLGRELLK